MTCRGQATSEYNFWVNSWQNKAREDKQKQTATQLLWINIASGQQSLEIWFLEFKVINTFLISVKN